MINKLINKYKIPISCLLIILYFFITYLINSKGEIESVKSVGVFFIIAIFIINSILIIKKYKKEKIIDYKIIIVGIFFIKFTIGTRMFCLVKSSGLRIKLFDICWANNNILLLRRANEYKHHKN